MDLLRKHSYVLKLVAVNRINEPLEIGPGPVFKVTCNATNQLSRSVTACSEVKKNKYFYLDFHPPPIMKLSLHLWKTG